MKAILPYRHTWVSQGVNGSYSHKGTKAIDFGSLKDYQDYNLYAPFDGTVVWADTVAKGAAIAFQSDEPVEYADGTVDYMTVITGHDNNRPNVGTKFKQGQLYSHHGTAGGVSKHSHLEVQRGKFVKPATTIKQQYGNVYKFENTVLPYEALFITEDTLIKVVDVEYPWKRLNNMSLIKITKDKDYEYKWSVDGNRYNTSYDITTMNGFGDETLIKDGWEEVLAVNGSLFFNTNEGGHMAEGLEKSRGTNNQELEMTAVTDHNNAMAIACVNDELWYASQSWIIKNKLNEAYGAITGLGLLLNGVKVNMHEGFNSQWNQISGRTVIGEDKDGNIMSYSFAGVTGESGMTCGELQTKCLALGFHNAICFDGGGSVWRRVNGKNDIITTRKVKNALILYRRKRLEEPKDELNTNDLEAQIKALTEELANTKTELESTSKKLVEALATIERVRVIVNE